MFSGKNKANLKVIERAAAAAAQEGGLETSAGRAAQVAALCGRHSTAFPGALHQSLPSMESLL